MLTISELITFPTFEERLDYLLLNAKDSQMTFEELRYLNQKFYNSPLWKQIRRQVISRDLGYDLAIPGKEIFGKALVHHMNPIKPKDILYATDRAINPEFLVTVSDETHRAIHYGYVPQPPVVIERKPGDTTLW